MAAPIALREDFDGLALRRLAKRTGNANQSRRLAALAEIYDAGLRRQAARIGGVGLQTIRDWVLRFNAGGPEGLIDGKAPGRSPKLNGTQRQELARIIRERPDPGDPWCGALAVDRSGAVGMGRVPHQDRQRRL